MKLEQPHRRVLRIKPVANAVTLATIIFFVLVTLFTGLADKSAEVNKCASEVERLNAEIKVLKYNLDDVKGSALFVGPALKEHK